MSTRRSLGVGVFLGGILAEAALFLHGVPAGWGYVPAAATVVVGGAMVRWDW